MPKQTFKIQGFHGGISSDTDPRDIQDIESPALVDANIDSAGRVKTLGSVGIDTSSTNTLTILANKGLYVLNSDRQLDGGENDENIIFNYDTNNTNIDAKDSEGWDIDVITFGGAISPVYYSADGVLRVSDSTFSQASRWFGYIEDQRFTSLNAVGPTAYWSDSPQSLATPTSGYCLISNPEDGGDGNGVNSAAKEYIGNIIDTGTSGDVAAHSSVNLRVGLQYESELNSGHAGWDYSINNVGNPSSDSTHLHPLFGDSITYMASSGNAIFSQIGVDGLSYEISEDESLVLGFFILTAEYDKISNVQIRAGDGSYNFIWKFSVDDISPNCWNYLVCSTSNVTTVSTSLEWGDTLDRFDVAVYQNGVSGTSGNASPSFYVSGSLLAATGSLDGWQPGVYTFHYTWLYDSTNKQESIPFQFSDIDTGGEPDNVNKVCIVGDSVLLNFDAYICPWTTPVAAAVDVSDHQIDLSAHGLKVGDIVRLGAMSGVTGIDTSTDYYVSSESLVAGSFRVSTNLANAVAATSIDLSGSDDAAITIQSYALDKRISGSRLYWKVEENDNYFLIGELDFIDKGFKWLPESDTNAYVFADTSDATAPILSKTSLVKGIYPTSANTIDTFKTNNGFSSEVPSVDAQYKTAVVQGRRVYIGNVKQDGKTNPDRMIKSQVNRFDTFPKGMGDVDVVIRDGENIVKLEAFADRILQFKERSLYIINVSETVDFLEDTYNNKGCSFPYHVTKTDFGIAWFNDFGVYFYDGKQVTNLLEKNGMRLISESDWGTFIKDGTDDTDMSSAHIGYIPKKRQLLIKNENKDVFIYDFVLRAWMKGSSKITINTNMTNFSLDGNQDLMYLSNIDSDVMTWNPDAAASSSFVYQSRDIDFGESSVRKKIYKVYVTYKTGATTNVQVKYDTNGTTTFDKVFQNGTNFTSNVLDNAGSGEWVQATLKPNTSSESNNIYSFALKFSATGTGAEVTRVKCVADSSDSLDGKYFDIYGAGGKTEVWIDTDNSGTSAPSGSGSYAQVIEVTEIETNDTSEAVAIAVAEAVGDHANFSTRVEGDTVIITDAASASRTNASDGDTGFTISIDREGGTSSVPATLEINDISFIYRMKSIR